MPSATKAAKAEKPEVSKAAASSPAPAAAAAADDGAAATPASAVPAAVPPAVIAAAAEAVASAAASEAEGMESDVASFLYGFGYVLLALGAGLLVDASRQAVYSSVVRDLLPAGFPLPSFKKLASFGWAVNLCGLGVLLIHQAKVSGTRLTIGALCCFSSAALLLAYQAYSAGFDTALGMGLLAQAVPLAPLACVLLIAYVAGMGSRPRAAYRPTSLVAVLHAALLFAAGAYTLFGPKGAAKAQLHTLLSAEGLESSLFLASTLAFASISLHTGMNDSKAAASQLCACATMAAAYGALALTRPKASASLWPLVAGYGLLAALGMLENLTKKGGKGKVKTG